MKPFRRRWLNIYHNPLCGSSVSGATSLLCSVVVYLSLILVPQSLWLFSNEWGLGSGRGSLQCEACSLLPAGAMSQRQGDGEDVMAADMQTNLTYLYERLCQGVCGLREYGGKEWMVEKGDGERETEVEGWENELFLQWLDENRSDGGW